MQTAINITWMIREVDTFSLLVLHLAAISFENVV